ncbi:hypothetical protein JW711_01365 [Candidatus Woesearchaeota archaeon]|nr:hypothetical protein [Candidatus Woesearchaeota archaeon]
MDESEPIYHGKRKFLGLKDLVISFYTQKCPYQCPFCDLKNKSSATPVSLESQKSQVDWVLNKYSPEIGSFQQLSAGNEGSILDRARFFQPAMNYLIDATTQMTGLKVLSLETRPEFISYDYLSQIKEKIGSTIIDVTVGFETQDDKIRNDILGKNIQRSKFEEKVQILGALGAKLTSYVMLKPAPGMSEEQGITEAIKTIEYLKDLTATQAIDLVVYLNPTYVAENAPISRKMHALQYQPPSIQSALQVVFASHAMNVPIYVGLWSENLAGKAGDFNCRADYNPLIKKALKEFNQTQDMHMLLENTSKCRK